MVCDLGLGFRVHMTHGSIHFLHRFLLSYVAAATQSHDESKIILEKNLPENFGVRLIPESIHLMHIVLMMYIR